MKDKAIEFLSKLQTDDLEFIHDRVIGIMLEFGHYVAEEQKKQCLKEALVECRWKNGKQDERGYPLYHSETESSFEDENHLEYSLDDLSILNSKNVCEQ
jgi:hypothetical protein